MGTRIAVGTRAAARRPGRVRWTVVLPTLACLIGFALLLAPTTAGRPPVDAVSVALCLPTVCLGLLLVRRRPDTPAGPALIALGAAPAMTIGVERWGSTFSTVDPWPWVDLPAAVQPGVWVWNLTGFVFLCLVFPDGRLPGRGWRAAPWMFVGTATFVDAAVSLNPAQYAEGGGDLPGSSPLDLPDPVWVAGYVLAGLALLGALCGAVASLVLRYRRGVAEVRLQLRWLMLGAGSVPALLLAGWLAEAAGVPTAVAYTGFLLAMLLLLPAAVTVAVLRRDLFDVDRLLSSSVAWLLTTLVSAAVFALVVLAGGEFGGRISGLGVTGAAFVTALLLLPVHRLLLAVVGHVLDRERTVLTARMRQFVQRVRDGQAAPEEVEQELRGCLEDESLRLLLSAPTSGAYVDLAGRPTAMTSSDKPIQLTSQDSVVGVIILGRESARRQRLARELAVEARLPIEVSRLRLELRGALADVRSSRSRLMDAVTEERRRLERDLHDGAQQRIVAVGMRLRSAQRGLPADGLAYAELERAVCALEETVAELRRLAHGVRPSRLDDGLGAALRAMVSDTAISVDLRVGEDDVTETVATTAYFVVAEGLANALKHSHATSVSVRVAQRGQHLTVELADDGAGGAGDAAGLRTLRDRVGALGGRIDIDSPPGAGTTIRAEF